MKGIKKHLFPIVAVFLFLLVFFSFVAVSPAFAAHSCLTGADASRNALIDASLGHPCKGEASGGGIIGLVRQLAKIFNVIVPFLIGLAVFLIIYGILRHIASADDEEKRTEARNFILWGIVGVFIMVSVWGLVNILIKTFNLDNSNAVVTDIYGKPVDVSTLTRPTTVPELITRVNAIGSYVIPFLISIAVFIVILGIVNYIRQGDNEEKRTEGRKFIIWGLISIFIMLSIWGLVNILVNSLELNNQIPTIPPLPTL